MAQQAQSLGAVRQALGLSSDVPDSDVKLLMKTQMGQNALKQIEAQPSGGPGFFAKGLDALKQHWEKAEPSFIKELTDTQTKPAPKAKPKAKPKAEDTGLPTPEQATTSPFTEIAQQLAQEYLGQVQQLQSLTSGAQTPGLEAEAQGGAEAALKGLGVGGAAEQFVANQPAVPLSGEVAKSQQALGNAQSAGALGMAGAIGAMGPAEAETLGAAPYSTLLNELISESAYRASSPSYGPSALGLNTANTPAWLQTVLGNIGLPLTKPNSTSAFSTPGLTTPTKAAPGGTSGTVPGSSGTTGGP